MIKCLHPLCHEEIWSEGEKLSHWCLEHAWRFNRGDFGSKKDPCRLLNKDQQAALAEWPDDLRTNNADFFPVEFVEHKMNDRKASRNWKREDAHKNTVVCDNQGTVVGSGCYPNHRCLKKCPPERARWPAGSKHVYCLPCYMKIAGLPAPDRLKLGFDF